MATIAGVTVTFALPENDTRSQNVANLQAADGSWKYYKFRNSDRIISIPVAGLSTSTKESLLDALEGDADANVSIDPDSHVDLGGGAGTAVNAKWIDKQLNFTKDKHEKWGGVMNFVLIP